MSCMDEDFSFYLLCVVCTRTQMYIMCTCAYVYMPMCAYICGSQRTTLDTLSWEPFILFLRPGLGSLRLSSLPRLAGWLASPRALLQHTDCRYAHHVSFLTWVLRVKNSGPCVCAASPFWWSCLPCPRHVSFPFTGKQCWIMCFCCLSIHKSNILLWIMLLWTVNILLQIGYMPSCCLVYIQE